MLVDILNMPMNLSTTGIGVSLLTVAMVLTLTPVLVLYVHTCSLYSFLYRTTLGRLLPDVYEGVLITQQKEPDQKCYHVHKFEFKQIIGHILIYSDGL